MFTKRRRLAACVGLAVLLIASLGRAGAPGGEPASIEPGLRGQIEDAFAELGIYFEPFDSQLKAFLWNNRTTFNVSRVEDDRVVEATLCVLIGRYDYSDFAEYTDSEAFRTWCDGLLESS